MKFRPAHSAMRAFMRLAVLFILVPAAPLICQVPAPQDLSVTKVGELTASAHVMRVYPTRDGARLYYWDDAGNALRLYEGSTGRDVKVASGRWPWASVSPRGDQIAFTRVDESNSAQHAWTMPLDTATGLATGPGRRVSLSPAGRPTFSPDGRWIVFASERERLVIVPASGGAEHVIHEASIVRYPVWPAEGGWIYFLGEPPPHGEGSLLQRVRPEGGEAEVVGVGNSGFLNASPDGRTLASGGSPVKLYDGVGEFLGEVADGGQGIWLSSGELLRWSNRRAMRLSILDLEDGTVTEVLPSYYDASGGGWSPDGRRVSTVVTRADSAFLVVSDLEESSIQEFRLKSLPPIRGGSWSPDGRWIALSQSGPEQLVALDTRTGETRALPTRTTGTILERRWLADSQRLRYISELEPDKPAGPFVTEIREVGFEGPDTLLDLVERPHRPWGVTWISDTTLFVVTDTLTYVRSLNTRTSREIFDVRNAGPSASPSGRLLAMRPANPNGGRRTAEVLTFQGDRISTVDFDTGVGIGLTDGFIFTPDERYLITTGARAGGGCCSIYRAAVDGSSIETLRELPVDNYTTLALSPGGRFLLFAEGPEQITVTLEAVDVSSLLGGGGVP